MTEYELLQKIKEAKKAIDEYQKEHTTLDTKSIWYDDLQKEIPDLLTKCHVLGAAGRTCSKCGGTGRE